MMATVNQQIDALLKRGSNPRRKNPAPGFEAGVFTNLDAPKNAKTRYFAHARDEWALSNGFPYRLLSAHTDVGAPIKFGKTRAYVAIDEGADGKPVTETWRISGLQFWGEKPAANPARKPARRVTLVAARNPARADDIPGDFSQSSARVYGRAWSDAKNASVKDVGGDAIVRLTFPDGEWLQMVFDSRAGALKCLKRLGFA